jgi:hypothetical protein
MNVQKLVNADLRDDWRGFAKQLFKLEDADPGYLLLARSGLSEAQQKRYVVAWCTYYNPGIAAVASERQGLRFWEYLFSVYPKAQRASERRHFRGAAGLKALADWSSEYPHPEDMVDACFGESYLDVRRNMLPMTQMGDYFYWKMADIQDTVFGEYCDFTGCEKYMPKVPKQGAEIIAELESTCFALPVVMATITSHVRKMDHPLHERKLALQEAETVCCVFKQHVHGDYKLGYRTAKAYKRVLGAIPEAPKTAKALLDGIWAGGIWTLADVRAIAEAM